MVADDTSLLGTVWTVDVTDVVPGMVAVEVLVEVLVSVLKLVRAVVLLVAELRVSVSHGAVPEMVTVVVAPAVTVTVVVPASALSRAARPKFGKKPSPLLAAAAMPKAAAAATRTRLKTILTFCLMDCPELEEKLCQCLCADGGVARSVLCAFCDRWIWADRIAFAKLRERGRGGQWMEPVLKKNSTH